jgi:hypothetical protein
MLPIFSDDQKGLIRALIYPVQFERDPIDGLDRTLALIVDGRALGASRDEYAAAVGAALSSEDSLSQLIPQTHSESVIREYLTIVRERLAG